MWPHGPLKGLGFDRKHFNVYQNQIQVWTLPIHDSSSGVWSEINVYRWWGYNWGNWRHVLWSWSCVCTPNFIVDYLYHTKWLQSEAIVPTRYPKWWTFGTSKNSALKPSDLHELCYGGRTSPASRHGGDFSRDFQSASPRIIYIVVFSQRLKTVCFQFWRYQKQFLLVIYPLWNDSIWFCFCEGTIVESQLRFVCPLLDHVALQGICSFWQRWHNFAREENTKRETP